MEKRLESRETELRDKEEELFLHLERSLRLDDEIERLKVERDGCIAARERLEREQTSALRQLQLQATQNEVTRRNLERARQDVVRQATVIRAERDALEREVRIKTLGIKKKTNGIREFNGSISLTAQLISVFICLRTSF